MSALAMRAALAVVACLLAACGTRGASSRPASGAGLAAGAAASEAPRRSLADAAAAGDWAAVLAMAARAGESDSSVAAAARAVDAATAETLQAALDSLEPGQFPASLIALRLGLLAEHRGERDQARALYRQVEGPLSGEARKRLAAVDARDRAVPATIAVLLPLSGPHAGIGREARAAVEIAAQSHRDLPARMVILDTAGDANTAVRRVDEAVARGAVAILGPVGDLESRAAAARAAEHGVPIGLLAPGAEEPAPGIFRLVSSATWEARAAAKTAKLLGYKTAAVLAPRDEHGQAEAQAFARTAAALGIRVVRDGRYDPTATDLESDLKSFFGLIPADNPRLRRHLRRHGRKRGWKTFSPDVPFELLYVPDSYKRASLVASYLPYFSIEVRTRDLMNTYALRKKHGGRLPSVVQLMGSSSWHHPALIPAGGKAVEGALILDSFAGGPDEDYAYDEAARFAERYRQKTGRRASSYAAQVHDAAALVITAASSARSRQAAERALSRARLPFGACGPSRIGPGRVVQRNPVVLRVEAGSFVLHEY